MSSVHDPIADFLTSIRNATARKKEKVISPYSKLKNSIATVLIEEGYVNQKDIIGEGAKKQLVIFLKYYKNESVIKKIDRFSRPSLRRYRGVDDLPLVMDGLGIAIISTPQGIMTDRKARQENVGGEVLCIVE